MKVREGALTLWSEQCGPEIVGDLAAAERLHKAAETMPGPSRVAVAQRAGQLVEPSQDRPAGWARLPRWTEAVRSLRSAANANPSTRAPLQRTSTTAQIGSVERCCRSTGMTRRLR